MKEIKPVTQVNTKVAEQLFFLP